MPSLLDSTRGEGVSRDQERSARHRPVRARTIQLHRYPKRELDRLRRLHPDDNRRHLPLTRADCIDGPRPCPFVSCTMHLYVDVDPSTGNPKLNFPDLEPDELGALTLEDAGRLMNVTRERVRQISDRAVKRLSYRGLREWADFVEPEIDGATPARAPWKRFGDSER